MVSGDISVEVVYATPDEQVLVSIDLKKGANAGKAIERSGLLQRFPEIDLSDLQIGVFSKVCALDRILEDGDRVEIYRSLTADPKDMRRQRAAAKAD